MVRFKTNGLKKQGEKLEVRYQISDVRDQCQKAGFRLRWSFVVPWTLHPVKYCVADRFADLSRVKTEDG